MIAPIPCLTLNDPYAHATAAGLKLKETRSWPTRYRGPLAIHASKALTGDHLVNAFVVRLHLWGELAPWSEVGRRAREWPRGCVVAVGRLVDVVAIRRIGPNGLPVRCNGAAHHHPHGPRDIVTVGTEPLTDERELALGAYCTGRFAWVLEDVRPVRPVAAKGRLGLWPWVPPEAVERLHVEASNGR